MLSDHFRLGQAVQVIGSGRIRLTAIVRLRSLSLSRDRDLVSFSVYVSEDGVVVRVVVMQCGKPVWNEQSETKERTTLTS